jgi:hypothetical protein
MALPSEVVFRQCSEVLVDEGEQTVKSTRIAGL